MKRTEFILIVLAASVAAVAKTPTADEIMRDVAVNQERSQEMRSAYVYFQSVLIRFHRGNGHFAREEISYFNVSPTPDGTKKERTYFRGIYALKSKLHEYDAPNHNYKGVDVDGEVISELAEELASAKNTRDGVAANLFPLTSAEQKRYEFRLEGTESYQGREVYRVTFRPDKKHKDYPAIWQGEALIDRTAHQPVLITTSLAKGVPMWVRMVFGTNLKQLGFKVTYQEVDDGVWFPATYGGEFVVKVLFLYKRRMSFSLRNADFERADISSKIDYGKPVQ